MSEIVPLVPVHDSSSPAGPDRSASRHLPRRITCGAISLLMSAYIADAVTADVLTLNSDPSIAGPTAEQLSCRGSKGVMITEAGTGLQASDFMRNMMAPTMNAEGICIGALHEGRTSRADMNARAIGNFALSLEREGPVDVILFADSEGGMGIPTQVKIIREEFGTKVRVAAAIWNATPNGREDLKKADNRLYVDNYDFPYGRGVVLATNIIGEWREGAGVLDTKTYYDAWQNMTKTGVLLTKSQLKNIYDGFPEVTDVDELRNADGSLPDFHYIYATTDDTIEEPQAVEGIQAKIPVTITIEVIETDEPFMHAKEWLADKYHIYEPTIRRMAEGVSARIDSRKAA